ncbi:MAG TPA: sigma-70 family RNA polymerase sigma factor [Acidimicrobiales bacterium]|jgi:trimeric autotransporter adhesin|nr:sigma-70 family RNA polymerase sigma factor [Acidimicrobiales bacterium]
MRKRGQTAEQEATDASLVARATAGDLAAFGELYRRHVDAAWRVALAVTTNPDDAADAVSDAFTRVFQALPERLYAADHFLPYLLAAVRNAAIDVLRRGGRQQPSEAAEDREWPTLNGGPVDFLLADEDASMVARAFRSLPERWRSVLWLTEVEQIPARDAAMLLGVSPNGVAQLAVRARAGLRERYLQAHLRQNDVRLGCRHTVDRLGAYAAGGLAPRDVAKVDQHLAGCDPCRARLADLQDLAPSLRRSVLPLPAGLAALALAEWELAAPSTGAASASVGVTSGASASAGVGATGTAGAAGTAAPVASVGVGAGAVTASSSLVASIASAALLVAGVVGAGAIADRRSANPPPTSIAAPAATASTSTSGAGARASAHAAAGASGADAGAAVDLAALADQIEGLPDELQRLAGTDLEALGKGRVKVATDAAVVDVDLADQRQPCRDIRVLGIPVACASPPSGNTVPPADAVVSAVEATGRAVEPPASAPSGLDLRD